MVQGFAAAPASSAKKKRSGAAKAATSKTIKRSSSKAPATKSSPKRTAKSSRRPAPPVYRRSAQQQPTPARYKEIQQALADKGYFNGAPDGNWGPDSVEALKRFQRDQNLDDDGKIGALSLMGLGLGPRRVAATASPKPVPSPQ